MTVKVKPLVWDECGVSGEYHAYETASGKWRWYLRDVGFLTEIHLTEDAAKAAAQADHEARILAAIEAPVQEPVALAIRHTKSGRLMTVARNIAAQGEWSASFPLYATPQPDETAALRAKLAEVEDDLKVCAKASAGWVKKCFEAEADRDEERKLADDLAERLDACCYLSVFSDEDRAALARHAARRKEQQG